MDKRAQSIGTLSGVGPARLQALEKAGLRTLGELIERMPLRYRDPSQRTRIAELHAGEPALLMGAIRKIPALDVRGGLAILSAELEDESGSVACVWFGQAYLRQKLYQGSRWMLTGTPSYRNGRLCIVGATIEDIPPPHTGIQAIYPNLARISQASQREWVRQALEATRGEWPDELPAETRDRFSLLPRDVAVWGVHQPQNETQLALSRRTLAFESLFLFQLALRSLRTGVAQEDAPRFPCDAEILKPFLQSLPYALTGAQRRVLGEILLDLDQTQPMARLVQGDVGCGKTILAFLALAVAARAGYQGALMAPTEILAQQHYEAAEAFFAPHGIRVGLLTGSCTGKARKAMYAKIEKKELDILIGTHALFSEGVRYARLGLVITDEQHRFGVRQRSALQQKGDAPHMLVLSATPIPRTLALVLYCDLSLSVVDELPPGRIPIRTHLVPEARRQGMLGFLRGQIQSGRQVYVVCPLVEESEGLDAASALEETQNLRAALPGLRIECVHGRQSAAEKEALLTRFRAGEIELLVSTTVIEVGVNVPNASVMVVENAERFGLAQLHQLRGRVGRGSYESFCFLMAQPGGRLDILVKTQDGFAIAEEDLKQRGPGEMLGTRQSGQFDAALALAGDVKLLEETHSEAIRVLRSQEEWAKKAVSAAQARYAEKLRDVGLH